MTSDRIQRLENIAQGYIDRGEFASVEWLVEAKGSTVTAGGVGVADPEANVSLPYSSIYRIYSMTKPIVSVMALILIEQGRLRLFDFLPQFDSAFCTHEGASSEWAPRTSTSTHYHRGFAYTSGRV